jgi:hypothetical protein
MRLSGIVKNKLNQGLRKLAGKSYYLARFHYQVRRTRQLAKQTQLILVYQMGKVGSSTVVRSLEARDMLAVNVHTFDPYFLKRGQKIFKAEFKATGAQAKTLWDQQLIRRRLRRLQHREPVKIITLVRDPVARNISHFFQWPNMIMEPANGGLHLRSPVFKYDRNFKADCAEKELAALFMTHFKLHDRPLNWFDIELKPNFEIDVYNSKFPRKEGYQILRKGNTEVMVIKLEKLNEVAKTAFKAFLGIESFELNAVNIGQEKKTSGLYRRYLETIRLPEEYLDGMYNSKYCRHFYGKEEIETFWERWSRSS